MNDIQKELDQAFNLISDIPVTHENVDRMFMAREHLRNAYNLAGKEASEKEADTDG